MNSGQQPLYASTPQPAYGSAPWQAPAQPKSRPTSKSLGGSIALLVMAIAGFVSTFLPYLTVHDYDYGDYNIKGWDVAKLLKEYQEFSAGPILILIGSILAAIGALVVIVNMNSGKNSNRVILGIGTIIAGLVVLGSGGATYAALDNILQLEGASGTEAVGLWLGCLAGLTITIRGIVILVSPKATQIK